MNVATKAQINRIERRLVNLVSLLNLNTETIMSTLQDLQTQVDALTAAGTEARADSARQQASTNLAIGLLQALTAKIAELAAGGPQLVTQAQLDTLVTQANAAVSDMAAANTARDSADAALDVAVGENTPPAVP